MFARYKKIFLIIIFLLIIGVFAWLLWRMFFSSTSTTPKTTTVQTETNNPEGLPVSGEGGGMTTNNNGEGGLPNGLGGNNENNIKNAVDHNYSSNIAVGRNTKVEKLTDNSTVSPTISSDGRIQYYNRDDGKFYKIDKDGHRIALSDRVFHDVQNVVWSKDKTKGIIEYPDGSKILYDFNKKKQVTLPSHWEDFSFAPTSDKIVAKSIGLDPENRWLVVANDDGSQAKNIEYIGTRDQYVYPDWSPNNQIIATYTKGVDFNRQQVFFVGLHGENFKSTIIEGRGLESKWSTKGDKLLYSVYNSSDDYKPRLWVVDAVGDTIGQDRHSFDIATWANKCTFASDTDVYCAVPVNLQKGAGLYPELADRTHDNLYKINLRTGTKQLIAVPNDAYNISQIIVPDSQNYLYFTDKKTGELYKVKLR